MTGTRTGQSETVTFNGASEGLPGRRQCHLRRRQHRPRHDRLGDRLRPGQPRLRPRQHGLRRRHRSPTPPTASGTHDRHVRALPENAAGLYDDGGSYIWFESNTVWNSDQGINLDVETRRKETDHLLVSGNTVHDDPGTSAADPSTGTNPPGPADIHCRRARPLCHVYRRLRLGRVDHRCLRARQHLPEREPVLPRPRRRHAGGGPRRDLVERPDLAQHHRGDGRVRPVQPPVRGGPAADEGPVNTVDCNDYETCPPPPTP